MRQLIIANKFLDALVEAGIIHEHERVNRVVIEAKVGEPIRLWSCRLGDERLIEIVESGGFEVVERRR